MYLVLDDNALFCRTMYRVFRSLGVEGQCFERWPEARAALEATPEAFHCALIDLGLTNGHSGLDVIEWIHSHYPHIQCILISAAKEPSIASKQPPYRRFLPKPFGLDEFVNAITC